MERRIYTKADFIGQNCLRLNYETNYIIKSIFKKVLSEDNVKLLIWTKHGTELINKTEIAYTIYYDEDTKKTKKIEDRSELYKIIDIYFNDRAYYILDKLIFEKDQKRSSYCDLFHFLKEKFPDYLIKDKENEIDLGFLEDDENIITFLNHVPRHYIA